MYVVCVVRPASAPCVPRAEALQQTIEGLSQWLGTDMHVSSISMDAASAMLRGRRPAPFPLADAKVSAPQKGFRNNCIRV